MDTDPWYKRWPAIITAITVLLGAPIAIWQSAETLWKFFHTFPEQNSTPRSPTLQNYDWQSERVLLGRNVSSSDVAGYFGNPVPTSDRDVTYITSKLFDNEFLVLYAKFREHPVV